MIHETINTILLAVFICILFWQKTIIKNMKDSFELLDIDKIKAAKDYLDLARDKQIELSLKEQRVEILDEVRSGMQNAEVAISEMHIELLKWHLEMLSKMTEIERSRIISSLPKNQRIISRSLVEYQAGKLTGKSSDANFQVNSEDI